jgi:hypothetical protein
MVLDKLYRVENRDDEPEWHGSKKRSPTTA